MSDEERQWGYTIWLMLIISVALLALDAMLKPAPGWFEPIAVITVAAAISVLLWQTVRIHRFRRLKGQRPEVSDL